jgi:hypothetical protein
MCCGAKGGKSVASRPWSVDHRGGGVISLRSGGDGQKETGTRACRKTRMEDREWRMENAIQGAGRPLMPGYARLCPHICGGVGSSRFQVRGSKLGSKERTKGTTGTTRTRQAQGYSTLFNVIQGYSMLNLAKIFEATDGVRSDLRNRPPRVSGDRRKLFLRPAKGAERKGVTQKGAKVVWKHAIRPPLPAFARLVRLCPPFFGGAKKADVCLRARKYLAHNRVARRRIIGIISRLRQVAHKEVITDID